MKKQELAFVFSQCVESSVRQKSIIPTSVTDEFVRSLYSHLSVLGRRDKDALELAEILSALFKS